MPKYRVRPDGLTEVETSAGYLPMDVADSDLQDAGLCFEAYDPLGRNEPTLGEQRRAIERTPLPVNTFARSAGAAALDALAAPVTEEIGGRPVRVQRLIEKGRH